ncbi:NADPH oxidoreductase [Kineococcus glutinatus]|uniref:NADPH oxidoreductase n=1 Tax=Kineococcus glutinatus TaxID=1070872 RepID=A0ABP9H6H6_9ACTN
MAARLARTAVTPLLPADYLDMVAPLRAGAELRGRVLSVTAETPDAATVHIRPGRDWAGHVPGQYVRLGVDVEGVRHWRPYSLTSPPATADGSISVTVKAVPGGVVSNHLVRSLAPGTLLQLGQAAGDFVLGAHRGPVLFVTAGSGITPVMGMLRSHLHELDDVVLVHSAPTGADVVFGAELRRLHARGRLRLVERHTSRQGVLAPADLDELVPDRRERQTWACGPTAMLDAHEAHWAATTPPGRLHTERFRPAVLAAGEGGTLTFTRSGALVATDGATTVLDAGEAAGVLMPSGCRMGICFRCVAPLRSGAVRDLRNGEITTAVPEDGIRIQTCVSAAAGPCDIDL